MSKELRTTWTLRSRRRCLDSMINWDEMKLQVLYLIYYEPWCPRSVFYEPNHWKSISFITPISIINLLRFYRIHPLSMPILYVNYVMGISTNTSHAGEECLNPHNKKWFRNMHTMYRKDFFYSWSEVEFKQSTWWI